MGMQHVLLTLYTYSCLFFYFSNSCLKNLLTLQVQNQVSCCQSNCNFFRRIDGTCLWKCAYCINNSSRYLPNTNPMKSSFFFQNHKHLQTSPPYPKTKGTNKKKVREWQKGWIFVTKHVDLHNQSLISF